MQQQAKNNKKNYKYIATITIIKYSIWMVVGI